MRSLLITVCSAMTALAAAGATAAETRIQAGGATFPKAIYERWASDYSKAHEGIRLEYDAKGSGAGIAGITNHTYDIGATDAAMSKKEREAVKEGEILHIPTVAGAVVIAYNLPGFTGDLKLTGEVIAGVYTGTITKWNDPKIAELNSGVTLPDTTIAPVYRSDSSGTSFVFTSYLATQGPEIAKVIPPTKQFPAKAGAAEKGNDGVANRIKTTPGGFGYIELTYAMNQKMPFALLKNKSGNFVKATTETVSKSGEKAEKLVDPIWNMEGSDAYPISAFTYLLAYKDLGYLGSEEKAKAVLGFLRYAVGEGQWSAAELFYAPLPDAVKAKAVAAIDSITFNGQPLK